MSIFAAIAGLTAIMLLLRRARPSALFVLLILAIIPVAATLVMGSIAAFKLGAPASSASASHREPDHRCGCVPGVSRTQPHACGRARAGRVTKAWLLALPLAALLVLVPMTSYVLAMPEYDKFADGCGTLPQPEDRHSVFVR